MDRAETIASANENFSLASQLVDAANKAAHQSFRWPQDELLTMASSFYGGFISPRDDHNWTPASIPKVIRAPQDLLREALEWSQERWSPIGRQMHVTFT